MQVVLGKHKSTTLKHRDKNQEGPTMRDGTPRLELASPGEAISGLAFATKLSGGAMGSVEHTTRLHTKNAHISVFRPAAQGPQQATVNIRLTYG